MKTQFRLATAMFIAALSFAACGGPKTGDAQDVAEGGTVAYNVNIQTSSVAWEGSKVVGGKHNGTISLIDGMLSAENGVLVAGSFNVDMNSMVCLDLDNEEYNGKLIGHLKSDDFFSVETHPTASFAITSATLMDAPDAEGNNYKISGNLRLKGNERNIDFLASVSVSETGLTAKASFSIDRTEWDVRYGSDKFFEGLADNVISDMISFQIQLNAEVATIN
jgi:polyisoprenoid-binding protein YceI